MTHCQLQRRPAGCARVLQNAVIFHFHLLPPAAVARMCWEMQANHSICASNYVKQMGLRSVRVVDQLNIEKVLLQIKNSRVVFKFRVVVYWKIRTPPANHTICVRVGLCALKLVFAFSHRHRASIDE